MPSKYKIRSVSKDVVEMEMLSNDAPTDGDHQCPDVFSGPVETISSKLGSKLPDSSGAGESECSLSWWALRVVPLVAVVVLVSLCRPKPEPRCYFLG